MIMFTGMRRLTSDGHNQYILVWPGFFVSLIQTHKKLLTAKATVKPTDIPQPVVGVRPALACRGRGVRTELSSDE